jgi:hypothetical protein
MSLLICSSAQDKYEDTSNLSVTGDNNLPVSYGGPGIQNPAQFTNNINPVMEIPSNSEVALKDITFWKKSTFKIGTNVSFSFYIGEYLRSRWGDIARKSLYEVTSLPIPIPLQEGTYNAQTFATMVNKMLDAYISYPDLFGTIWVDPWTTQNDGTNTKGYVFNMMKGPNGGGRPANRTTDMETAYNIHPTKDSFTWVGETYTATGVSGFDNNQAIITDVPLSLNGGRMDWDVSGATGGWRVMLSRPQLSEAAWNIRNLYGAAWGVIGAFSDIMLEYSVAGGVGIFEIRHSVEQDGVMVMREVEYYNNNVDHFTPILNSYLPAKAGMYRGTATTSTDLGAHPDNVTIDVYGEDTVVSLWIGATEYVMTDSRLCIEGNAGVLARTPTRNRFIKPIGINTWALYPKISLAVSGEVAILDEWSGIPSDDYKYPQPSVNQAGVNGQPANAGGIAKPGSSFYMRGVMAGAGDSMSQLVRLADTAKPYESNSADAQKQYVGLDGPTTVAPAVPVRIGEGHPVIGNPAVGVGGSPAWGMGIVTIPSAKGVGDWKTAGLYVSKTSDVSEILGFRNISFVAQGRFGNSYLYANRPAALLAIPTDTPDQYFGWYVGSESEPTYSSGPLFIRCPTLTHQSYNFGKGIPSKIIASIPPESLNRDTVSGGGFFAPSEMTYLTLNNTETLHFNDITLEIVDKNEQVVDILDRNTTATLHFRKSK